jgi:hypothetical protein
MTDPMRAAGERRARARRKTDPAAPGALTEAAISAEPAAPVAKPDPAAPVLSAHLLGQAGQKRGLRGGPETLAKAKAAYLTAEWSGPTDRRGRAGLFSKTKI